MKVPNLVLRCVPVGVRFIVGPALAVMLLTGNASSADIRVFSGGAPQAALQHLAPEFERVTGHRLEFIFQLVTEIQRKLAAGEKADGVLLPPPPIAATGKTLPLRRAGRLLLAPAGSGAL